jgi:hypothetical protein
MTLPVIGKDNAGQTAHLSLDALFQQARGFGLVNIYTHEDGSYSAKIKFPTVSGTTLEANSGYNHTTPSAALIAALEKTEEIKKHFKGGGGMTTETPVRLMPPDYVLIEMLKKIYVVPTTYRVGTLKRQIECEAFQAWLAALIVNPPRIQECVDILRHAHTTGRNGK